MLYAFLPSFSVGDRSSHNWPTLPVSRRVLSSLPLFTLSSRLLLPPPGGALRSREYRQLAFLCAGATPSVANIPP